MSPSWTGRTTTRAHDADDEEPLTDVGPAAVERERRTAIERIGLAAVAVVMAALFAAVAVAAFVGGEFFLAAMGLVGCMMTLAVGGARCSAADEMPPATAADNNRSHSSPSEPIWRLRRTISRHP